MIKKIIKKYIAKQKTKKILKLLEFFEDNYSISGITFIKPIKGYDQDIFKKQKHPEKNPSIYSSEYADISPPKHFSNYNEAKEKADEIYAIPENCKDCLGGANLMMYASSTILSSEGFTLYCPSVFGFIRNQSNNNLFNLVKKGDISMTSIFVHSPGVVTITNNKEYKIKVSISKGTILDGSSPNLSPLITTESVYIELSGKESQQIELNNKPLFPEKEILTGTTLWTCSTCHVSCAYPYHICPCNGKCSHSSYSCFTTGTYHATSFVKFDTEQDSHKSTSEQSNQNQSSQDQSNNNQEYCRIDDSCNVWNDDLKNKKIDKSCIAYSPLKPMEELYDQTMKYAIHEANVMEIDGDYYLIEKMGPDPLGSMQSSSSSSKKNQDIDKNGYINTRHCKVDGNKIITDDGDVLKMNEEWKTPSQNIYGKDVFDRIQDQVPYSLDDKNCQEFARNLFPECNFDKPKAKNAKLINNAVVEAISNTLPPRELSDIYMYKNFGIFQMAPP